MPDRPIEYRPLITAADSNAAMEEAVAIMRAAMVVLDLIVAEFNSDPMSVQCFDLRTVARAKQLMLRWKMVPDHLKLVDDAPHV